MEATRQAKRRGTALLPRLRATRLRAGLTQDQLAAKAGVQQATISRLEFCDHAAQALTAQKLADALGVEPEDLEGGNEI